VEAADGGTLFLDEVVDMPPPIQASLLRFLALGEFRRLGETEVRHTDVRVIAATHADLDEALRVGRLRRDLYYRLDVFRIQLPPLRERCEDLPELVAGCSQRVAERLGGEPLVLKPSALEEAGGNRARAAERLGLHRSNLVRMIRDLEIDVARAVGPEAKGS